MLGLSFRAATVASMLVFISYPIVATLAGIPVRSGWSTPAC